MVTVLDSLLMYMNLSHLILFFPSVVSFLVLFKCRMLLIWKLLL